jgi:hypothetical protein
MSTTDVALKDRVGIPDDDLPVVAPTLILDKPDTAVIVPVPPPKRLDGFGRARRQGPAGLALPNQQLSSWSQMLF